MNTIDAETKQRLIDRFAFEESQLRNWSKAEDFDMVRECNVYMSGMYEVLRLMGYEIVVEGDCYGTRVSDIRRKE